MALLIWVFLAHKIIKITGSCNMKCFLNSLSFIGWRGFGQVTGEFFANSLRLRVWMRFSSNFWRKRCAQSSEGKNDLFLKSLLFWLAHKKWYNPVISNKCKSQCRTIRRSLWYDVRAWKLLVRADFGIPLFKKMIHVKWVSGNMLNQSSTFSILAGCGVFHRNFGFCFLKKNWQCFYPKNS